MKTWAALALLSVIAVAVLAAPRMGPFETLVMCGLVIVIFAIVALATKGETK